MHCVADRDLAPRGAALASLRAHTVPGPGRGPDDATRSTDRVEDPGRRTI